ncbi:hypothetical protein TNCV_400421 [Trichonephila clavipes]|nr:hypothetical protein TNCV_400421 [Trichonephila clavipes]
MSNKDIREFVQSFKILLMEIPTKKNGEKEDEKEMNNTAHVATSSDMKNVRKSMCNYLDANSNGEMNNKMDDIEQFFLEKTMRRSNYFPKFQ